MDDLLQAALDYADLGFRVFPLKPGEKVPASENGLLDATTDAALIEQTWQSTPYNLGIATDGMLVVDIDGRNNPWLSTLGERAYELMGCPIVRTPSGGSHRYFKQPAGRTFRNTTSAIAPRVDTRANGGYVVAPPSFLESGGGYQWMPEFELVSNLNEPPKWLIDLLDDDKPDRPAVITHKEHGDGNPIPSGQRNDTLARMAGVQRRYGATQAEIVASLHVTNCSRCQPPMPAAEVEQIAASICRYTPDQFATGAVEGHYYELTGAKQPNPFPVELLRPPGFLSKVIDYNLAGAYRQQPILALAGAVALLATITGRKVRDDVGTRTNLYILGVGASGSGKDRSRVVNKDLLFRANAQQFIGPESPASASGLFSAVHHQPAILLQWDEIGRLLSTLGGKFVSPHLANITTVLMKLFTSSASIYYGDAYSDREKNKFIPQPHAVLYGTTVPKNLYENMSADSISDGFLGRLLIFESETPSPDYRDPETPDPAELVELIRGWTETAKGGNLQSQHPEPMVMFSTRGAIEVWAKFRDECLELERAANENAPLWTRAIEKARKLALLHACSRGALEVGIDDARWGRAMALHLTERLSDVGADWIAQSHADANRQEIMRWLKSRPMQAATITELARAIRRLMKKERELAIEYLEEIGAVVRWEEDTGGRRVKKIRAISAQLDGSFQHEKVLSRASDEAVA